MSKAGKKETPEEGKKEKEDNEKKDEKRKLKEYDKLISFYKHDDKLGTDLLSFGTLINSGLFSVLAIILSSELQLADRFLLISAFGVVGIFANIGLFLRQSRLNVYMEAWMLNGRNVENELRQKGYNFAIFKTQKMIQNEKKFEYKEDGKTKTRCLRDAETLGAHRLSLRSWIILVLLWLAISLFACVKWLTL